MTYNRITLIKDTISKPEVMDLAKWLTTYPRLTKGELTIEFEKKWSEWLGVKYSVFVNSGSSANLAMVYSLIASKKLRNKKIIVPSVSWVTTVTPAIQLGLKPIICDCDENDLGLNIDHLRALIKKHKPASLILVHVLGVPNQLNEIMELCKENDIMLLEDTCESVGSRYNDQKLGSFGDMSSFSFYYGHHMSTIEGGMVCTNDEELYHILLAIRSHGWDRDLPESKRAYLRQKYGVNEFRALYTFYYPGFNIRSTDLQAFLGLTQLSNLDNIVERRKNNFDLYNKLIKKDAWKITPPPNSYVSNFAYPLITENIDELTAKLEAGNVDCRPLICGSMNEQPFWYERYGKSDLPNATRVHEYGLYLPNHQELSESEIIYITNIVNSTI